MFYSITGEVVHSDNSQVAIDVNGVAYLCYVSFNTLKQIGSVGAKATLYTYLKVSEDAMDLYGFYTKEELDAFKLLISVSGVGPKAGISILSELTPSQLFLAISAGDVKTITAAQGVGPKVGQRIILELKDKVSKLSMSGADYLGGVSASAASQTVVGAGNAAEAVSALVMLGYSQSEAAIAVKKVDTSLPVEEIIKQALKQLM